MEIVTVFLKLCWCAVVQIQLYTNQVEKKKNLFMSTFSSTAQIGFGQ